MKKNIIYIHMESLSQQTFNHRQWFPGINALMQKSIRINRFFSSATSTFMALSDMLYGCDTLLEHNTEFGDSMTVNKQCNNIFEILSDYGYETLGTESPTGWSMLSDVWKEHNDNRYIWDDVCVDMLDKVEDKLKNKNSPLAIYFWNPTSHTCCFDRHKLGEHGLDYWQRGWSNLDRSVTLLVQLLMKYNELDNTIIIGFGDHGDDFWTHGGHGGFTHAIEPYTSLIHTPAFIFHPQLNSGDINHLVSLTDLKKISLQLLNIEHEDAGTLSNYNLLGGRKYCFSRNLSAAQPMPASNAPLQKGYSVTSEYFHLLKLKGQYYLYSWPTDPGNHFNLLTLFTKKKDGSYAYTPGKVMKKDHLQCHPHYTSIMYPKTLEFVLKSYYEMKEQLDLSILEKQRCAC